MEIKEAFQVAERRITVALGIPRATLWSKAGMTRQWYEALVSSNPTMRTIRKLALLYGCDWRDLAGAKTVDQVAALPLPAFDWLTAIEAFPQAIRQEWTLEQLERAANGDGGAA
jgi:hypothetical protein